jgi:hypothetical protein
MLSLLKKPIIEEASAPQPLTEDLQAMLTYMIRYGRPRLSYLDNGWYCKVEMNTNTAGTQFDVASDFGCQTPVLAAKECHQRIINALKTLGA